jgi:outer membrane protein assembly factor BamC
VASRRTALDRVGFTVVDRDRSKGTYFVRYADPGRQERQRILDKLMFWKTDTQNVEQYRIIGGKSTSQPRDRPASERHSRQGATGEKILSLLRDQLK